MANSLSLVTGATGHVGLNLVTFLRERGLPVRAGVRNMEKAANLKPLGCEIVRTELLEVSSLEAAMQGVDVVYALAAAFKMWSKDPEHEIIQVNLQGTRNLMEAAARAGVRKVVYVSSMTAIDSSVQPFSEATWNPTTRIHPYEYSKTQAEKLALELAKRYGIEISTILPGAIFGPGYQTPTESTALFPMILGGKMSADPQFYILAVDARDVAKACWLAASKGRNGGRYFASDAHPISTTRMIEIAREMFPDLNLKEPRKMPRGLLLGIAYLSSAIAKLTHKKPMMSPDSVKLYAGARGLRADMSTSSRELGFEAMPMEKCVRDTFKYERARES